MTPWMEVMAHDEFEPMHADPLTRAEIAMAENQPRSFTTIIHWAMQGMNSVMRIRLTTI